MTIWLDVDTVRSYIGDVGIGETNPEFEVEDRGVSDGRATIAVRFLDDIVLESYDCSQWESLLGALRNADASLEVTIEYGDIVVLVSADETAYRS